MRALITILCCLALAGSAAAADRAVTATPIDQPVLAAGAAGPAGVCVYGNDGAAAYAITDFIWGAESYATVFPAPQAACGCAGGFNIEQVHFFMNFAAADVPATFNVVVGFHEALFDQAAGCSVPGPEICTSQAYQISITAAGLYDIALPLDPATCACAFFDYDYAVSITFPTAFPTTARPDAVTDQAPVGCTSWNDYGSGWTDVADYGFPGELIMYADVVCCEPPVPDNGATWGGLKSMYR